MSHRSHSSHVSKILTIALAAFTTSSSVYAASIPFFQAPGAAPYKASLDQLKEAFETVRNDLSIRALLADANRHSLTFAQHVADSDLKTTKFQDFYKGLEVIGSMAFHQVGQKGTQVVNRIADFDLETQPTLSEAQAMQIALSTTNRGDVDAKPELKILPDGEANSARLIYSMDLKAQDGKAGRRVVINAHSGEIIANVSKDLQIAPIQIYTAAKQGIAIIPQGGDTPADAAGCQVIDIASGQLIKQISAKECQTMGPSVVPRGTKCQIVFDGAPVQVDTSSCQLAIQNAQVGPAADDAAQRAAANSTAVLNYYATHHNRNSYDNAGSVLVSVVHGGVQYVNAHWSLDEKIMVYGDGDGKTFADFTRGVDVAGHEMTHGVTMETAKLDMMGQSGALNEANSDFFGILIANGGSNWALGQQLFLQQGPTSAVRNLQTPASLNFCEQVANGQCSVRKPYPTTLAQMEPVTGTCDDSNDNCWVHINATIPGHASYLVTQAIGPQKAEHLYYLTLTQSLSASDTITTAAAAYKRTCSQVFDAATCGQVNQAFAQVGL